MPDTEVMNAGSPSGLIPQPAKRAKPIRQFFRDWSLSKSTGYNLISQGKLRAVKIGTRTMVLAEDEQRFAESLKAL